MEHEGGYFPSTGIDPTERTCGLHAESGSIGESHREIVGNATTYQTFHIVDIATEIVATVAMVVGLAIETIVRRVNADDGSGSLEGATEVDIAATMTTILGVIVFASVGMLGEIDGSHIVLSTLFDNLTILVHQPREGVAWVVVYIAPRVPYRSPLSTQDATDGSA